MDSRWQTVTNPNGTLNDVLDASEVAAYFTVAGNIDRFNLEDRLGENEYDVVKASLVAIDGKEAERGGGQAVQMPGYVGYYFSSFLRGALVTQWLIHIVDDTKGHRCVRFVYRRKCRIAYTNYAILPV